MIAHLVSRRGLVSVSARLAHDGGHFFSQVVLDHGMYRELRPAFRRAYCGLWTSLLTRDHITGRAASAALGVRRDHGLIT